MAGNTLSNFSHGEPLRFDVYQLSARLAVSGTMAEGSRTLVEYGGNTPVLPPLAPPSRAVPIRERMQGQDPLVGRPIRPEPFFHARPVRRLGYN